MKAYVALTKEFESLRHEANPQRRGYAFQHFVAGLFQDQHFRVETKPRAAKPRQVDLFASRGSEEYLIETKWRKDPANINDVDSLFTRLAAVPASVTGVLVSYVGFTQGVIEQVKNKSDRPVLLVSGSEIQDALLWNGSFLKLLHDKKHALLINRDVLLDNFSKRRSQTAKVRPSDLPSSTTQFLFPDGRRTSTLVSGGAFGMFTFVREMPDIDWVSSGGSGVSLDISVSVDDQFGLLQIIHRMAEMGWVSNSGTWCIQQATANWHGFGAQSLAESILAWKERYEDLETHHSEELCYFDEVDDGFYTLTAALSADSRRAIWHVDISFQLRGIPLDLNPLRELSQRLGIHERLHFRPKNESSVLRGHPERGIELATVEPVAFIVAASDMDIIGESEWVVGLVVKNPFKRLSDGRNAKPEWVPDGLRDTQYLICGLRSWHAVDSNKSAYELWMIESTWTSDAFVAHVMADWKSSDGGAGVVFNLYGGLGVEDHNDDVTYVRPPAFSTTPDPL